MKGYMVTIYLLVLVDPRAAYRDIAALLVRTSWADDNSSYRATCNLSEFFLFRKH